MAHKLSIEQIMCYTGLKRRTLERVLSLYRRTGHATPQRLIETRGRKSALSADNIGVQL
jgi:hypothetical protein